MNIGVTFRRSHSGSRHRNFLNNNERHRFWVIDGVELHCDVMMSMDNGLFRILPPKSIIYPPGNIILFAAAAKC